MISGAISEHLENFIIKVIVSIIKGSDFLLCGLYGRVLCHFILPLYAGRLCTWAEDEGLTLQPWLAEGQYYRKRWQSCPILKLWGLIFLKSPAIVFDKSIWEAFRERIRDMPWPTFSPLLLFLSIHCRYRAAVLIKRASKTGTATFNNSPPYHPPPESPPSLHLLPSVLLSLVVALSICPCAHPSSYSSC